MDLQRVQIMQLFKNNKGFSFIEVIVTIAIIGILSTITIFTISGIKEKSLDAKIQKKMGELQTHATVYYANTNTYAGFCGTAEASEIIDAAFSYTDSTRTPDLPFYNDCKDDDDEWIAMAPLYTTGNFCVDSTGDKLRTTKAFPLVMNPDPAQYVNNCAREVEFCGFNPGTFGQHVEIMITGEPACSDPGNGLPFPCNITHDFYNHPQVPPGMMPGYTGTTMCDDGNGNIIDADAYIADSNNYEYHVDSNNTNNIISGGFNTPYNTTGWKTGKIGSSSMLNFNATLAPGASIQTFVSQSCFLPPSGAQWCHAYHVNINPQ